MSSKRKQAIKKLADLEWNGVDYQKAVQEVLCESDEFAILFRGMDEDEKQYEMNCLSTEASTYNERRR